jgi:hypothetical protein
VELPTVSVKVADPNVPLLAHARTVNWCVPEGILMLVLILLAEPVWYTVVPST